MSENPILAIDICNSKVISLIAKNNQNNEIAILGFGSSKSNGISKGKITNMDRAAASIKHSIDEAKLTYQGEFSKVFATISAVTLEQYSVKARVNVPSGEVSVREIKTLLNSAIHNAAISNDYEAIHVIPSNFTIDNSLIQDPQNYIANHLEAKVNIFCISKNYLNNIKQAIRNCGIDSVAFALNSYVGSSAVVEDEIDEAKKTNGYLVIDIGSTSTYASIYKGKSCIYSKFYPIGGFNISKDISIMVNANIDDVEDFKIQRATVKVSHDEAKEKIKLVKTENENDTIETSMEYLSTIAHCRLEELLFLIKDDIEKYNLFNVFKSGIIITGGSSKVKGLKELCFKVFENQKIVRIDKGRTFINEHKKFQEPMYATTIGLVEYALNKNTYYEIDSSKKLRAKIIKLEPKKPISTEPEIYQEINGANNKLPISSPKGLFRIILGFFNKHL
jgi:cell division protein FtsA